MTGFLGIIFWFVALVPSIIILIGCCIILNKMRNEGAVFMLVGKTLGLLASIIVVILNLITSRMINNDFLGIVAFALPFVSLLASFLFAFGFIRLARTIEVEE
jgi:hypothetical protein